MSYTVAVERDAPQADRKPIGAGLLHFNTRATGDGGFQTLVVLARAAEGGVVGGAIGEVFWGWLHLQQLWVEESLRSSVAGSALLAAIEAEALRLGCVGAHLDTFSFKARPFYERHAYEVFGSLDGFPAPYTRYFMRKLLVERDATG